MAVVVHVCGGAQIADGEVQHSVKTDMKGTGCDGAVLCCPDKRRRTKWVSSFLLLGGGPYLDTLGYSHRNGWLLRARRKR